MKPKNQAPFATLCKIFPLFTALWLYFHWDDVKRLAYNVLDVIILVVGLGVCYVLLLIGGTL